MWLMVDLEKVIDMGGNTQLVRKELAECKAAFDVQKEKAMKDLKTLGNNFLGLFGLSTDNFKFTEGEGGKTNVQFVQNTNQ